MAEVDVARPGIAGDTTTRLRPAALAGVLIPPFMAMLDVFIVNIAAPSIERQLNTTFAVVQLVVGGYVVAFAMGLVTGGRLGDMFGRRRVFAAGIVCFGITSIGCAAAPTADVLISFRVLQGLSAALMLPQVLALIQVNFPAAQHNRLFGYYGATLSLGGIVGQLLGGLLVRLDLAGLGWRTIFAVNVPLCAVALFYALRTIQPTPRSDTRVRFDPLGVLFLSAAVALLLCPMVFGAENGWPAWVWPMLAGAVVLFAVFAWWENRLPDAGNAALLPLRLFRLAGFRNGLPTAMAFYFINSGLYFVLAFYLQDGIGLTPLQASLVFLALAVPTVVASLAAQSVFARFGARALSVAALVMILGLAAIRLGLGGDGATEQVVRLLPGLVLTGAGQGLVLPCLMGLVLRRVRSSDAGVASGGLMTAAQTAVALGVAAVGALFHWQLGGNGYETAFGTSIVLLGVLGVASLILLRRLTARAE
jgi:MFS family permease